jgi:proteic killer suppression protein
MPQMLRSFACRETERLFADEASRRLPTQIQRVARRKLLLLHQARRLDDLRAPPGNRLEALKGDRDGQHSIRINDQWRICFRWQGEDVFDVEIVDYH